MNNEQDNPLVSVVIPTYKRPDMLGRAIDSVLNQTYDNIEIIVVDDNDEDSEYRKETEEFMAKYANVDNLVYLKHKKNKNGAAARNTGIRNAKGKYIAFLDDDDEFLPKKIEFQVNKLLETSEEFAAVYCNKNFYIDGIRYNVSYNNKFGNLKKEILSFDIAIGAGSTLLIKKEVLLEINGFDETFTRHQDVEILVRFFNKYKIDLVKKPLVNIYKDSRINSPNIIEYKAIKDNFLKKFEKEINDFDNKTKNYILKKNRLGIAYYYLKDYKLLKAFNLLKKTPGVKIKDYFLVFLIIPFKSFLRKFSVFKKIRGVILTFKNNS